MQMTPGGYLLGVLLLCLVGTAVGAGAWWLRSGLLPGWSGAPARLAEVVIGLAVVVGVEEVLGSVGLFRRGAVVAGCVAAGLTAAVTGRRLAVVRRAGGEPAPRLVTVDGASPLARVAAVVAAGSVSADWVSRALGVVSHGFENVDTLWFHLPFAARAVQTGWLTRLHFNDRDPLTVFFPATAELFHATGMLLFRRDTLSPFVNVGWLALAFLAAWCIGRSRGAGAVALVGAAVVLGSPLMTRTQPGEAKSDIAAVFFLLAALGLLLQRPPTRPAVVLAGVAAGLAVSCQPGLVVPVLALTVGVVVVARQGERLRTAVLWLVPVTLAGGFWYVRNWARTGNPLPWYRVHVGPLSLPSPPFPVTGNQRFSILRYATDGHIARTVFAPSLTTAFGRLWPVMLAVAVAGSTAVLLGRRGRGERLAAATGLVALGAYVVTPQSAGGPAGHPFLFLYNLRYLVPGLVVAYAVVALTPGFERGRRQLVLLAALVVLLAATEWKVDRYVSQHRPEAVALTLVVLLAGAGAWYARSVAPRGALAVGLAVLAAVAVGGGWRLDRTWLAHRYDRAGPVYAWAGGVHHARIALAGSYLQYLLFGQDLSNRVQYLGRAGPHGAYAEIRDCREWRQALVEGRYDYVVTVPVSAGAPEPPQAAWTRSDRAAAQVLGVDGQAVFRIDGRLHPEACT